MGILDDIVAKKRRRLTEIGINMDSTENKIPSHIKNGVVHTNRFFDRITKKKMGIIAEVKMASPSEGILTKDNDIKKRVKMYEDAGADALSIVTEEDHFLGCTSLIKEAKTVTSIPVLQKDFIIHQSQILNSHAIGTDALLLIARIVNTDTLRMLVTTSISLGIEPVIEVYNHLDLEKALKTDAPLIAVNSRDLDTFKVDIEKASSLAREIPTEKTVIGFSGIRSMEDMLIYKEAGVKAILVGSVLMKSTLHEARKKISHLASINV